MRQVVDGGVALGAVVGEVELAGGPEESELALGFSAAEPVEVHVHGFFLRGIMVSLATPTAVELSHWMRVGGAGVIPFR